MKPISRAMLLIALFLAVDVTVYLSTAHEYTGGLLIVGVVIAFTYLGYTLRQATKRAAQELAADPSAEIGGVELEHVGPTIWPAVFSVSAIVLALGAVTIKWLLIPGGILFVASALGWFRDVRHQHEAHDGPSEGLSHEPTAPTP
jgi:Cytochrome c oxidase subunit IV